MSDDKPTILMIDVPRQRSPLLTQFQDYISRKNGPFNVVIDKRIATPVERIIKDRLKGINPDYIYTQYDPGSESIQKSVDYINTNKIRIIIDVRDVEEFSHFGKVNRCFTRSHVRFVTARWRRTENYHSLKKLQDFVNKKEWLKDAKIIHIPWGINPDIYEDRNLKRDIDVSLICTIKNTYHANRKLADDILRKMSGKIKVQTGNMWGNEYINALFRSKIFIVEGSKRDFMVQKYLEGPACGTMLLGEIPSTARDIFVDKVSIVEIIDYSKIKDSILYYINHEKERIAIAKEGQRRILECCTLDRVVKEFEDTIVKDWKA